MKLLIQVLNLQVTSRETVRLSLVGGMEFWLYIHGEGEEFFLHYDLWPSVPKFHHVKRPEASADFVIKKSMEISDGNCYWAKEYSYFGNFIIQASVNDIQYNQYKIYRYALQGRVKILFLKL